VLNLLTFFVGVNFTHQHVQPWHGLFWSRAGVHICIVGRQLFTLQVFKQFLFSLIFLHPDDVKVCQLGWSCLVLSRHWMHTVLLVQFEKFAQTARELDHH